MDYLSIIRCRAAGRVRCTALLWAGEGGNASESEPIHVDGLTDRLIIIPRHSSGTAEQCPDVRSPGQLLSSQRLCSWHPSRLGVAGQPTSRRRGLDSFSCLSMLRIMERTAGQPRHAAFFLVGCGLQSIGDYK